MKETTIVVNIMAEPEHIDLVKNELLKLVDITRTEEGCINYSLYQDNENPRHFMVYENWRTFEQWEEHMRSPYVLDALKATKGVVNVLSVNEMMKLV